MITKYKNLIIATVVIVLIFVGYSMFFKPQREEGLMTATQANRESVNALGADIIRAINQINALELDLNVFDHPVLRRLVDKTQIIEPQAVSRTNPFAPLDESEEGQEDQEEQEDSDDVRQ